VLGLFKNIWYCRGHDALPPLSVSSWPSAVGAARRPFHLITHTD